MIVCKFGGSSLSSEESVTRVVKIVKSSPARRFIVVSAMGKASPEEEKITDLLIKAYNGDGSAWKEVRLRHEKLCKSLGVKNVERELDHIEKQYESGCGFDYFVSRGEFLMAKIISALLCMPFIDGKEIAVFSDKGKWLIKETLLKATASLSDYDSGVIAGFYGGDEEGNVHLFERGGSDISGAITAYAVDAELYENWTDVDGFLSADPRFRADAEVIRCLSYGELAELSYYGAGVLHYMSVLPLTYKLIPLCVRNTFDSNRQGTTVTYRTARGVKGVAVKEGVLYDVQGDAEKITACWPDAVKTVNGVRLFSSDPLDGRKLARSGAAMKIKMTDASVIAAAGCDFHGFCEVCALLSEEKVLPLFAEYTGGCVHFAVERRKADYSAGLIYDKLLGDKKR